LLLAVGAGAFWLWWNGGLVVSAATITVRGNQRVPAEALIQASELEGKLIFQVRPADAAARLAQVPGIAEAHVRVWPPAEVEIEVRERAAFVNWQRSGEAVWLGADGKPAPREGAAPGLTLVDGDSLAQDGPDRLRLQVMAYLLALQRMRPAANQIYYGRLEGVYFRAAGGWTVYLGEEGAAERKLALLEGIEREAAAQGRRLEIVDLRSADHPQIR
jgi:cell division septal protein FtsQ